MDDVPCTRLLATGYGPQPGAITQHVYQEPGVYTVTTQVTLSNGRVEPQSGPRVLVSPYLPDPSDHTVRNWILWGAALLLAIAVLLALFRVRRLRSGRRLGTFIVLLAVWTYLPPTVADAAVSCNKAMSRGSTATRRPKKCPSHIRTIRGTPSLARGTPGLLP